MAGSIPWITITIAGLILVLLVIFLLKRKKGKSLPDYRSFFYMGLVFLAIGIIYRENSIFFILGLVYVTLGLLNKDKWGKHKKWKQLNKEQKKLKLLTIIGLVILLILGLVVFIVKYLQSGGI